MGLIMSVFGLGSIVGPLVGGFITDHFGWRWVFYVNLPLGLVALASLVILLPRLRGRGQVRIDSLIPPASAPICKDGVVVPVEAASLRPAPPTMSKVRAVVTKLEKGFG